MTQHAHLRNSHRFPHRPIPVKAPEPTTQQIMDLLKIQSEWQISNGLKLYLNNHGNPNAILPNGKTLLFAFLETAEHPSSLLCFELLLQKGAIISNGPNGHNALSYALELNLLNYAKSLLDKGHTIPQQKLQDPFLQAIFQSWQKKPADTFLNIDATNKAHATALHVAAHLGNHAAIQKLLSAGANPLLKDNNDLTPLHIAYDKNDLPIIKALVGHHLLSHPEFMNFNDLVLFKAKHDGITIGGFYKDANQTAWLVKQGHYSKPLSVAQEYLGGALFKFLLADNAPETEIIVHDEGKLLIGSKLLDNFQTLSAYEPDYRNPFFSLDGQSFQGKPLKGFFEGLSAIKFLNDTDAHFGNVGLINHGNYYSFAKVDHSFCLNFYYEESPNLDTFRAELKFRYHLRLEDIGFDEVYGGIAKIAKTDFSVYENLVSEKLKTVKSAMEVLELNHLNQDYKSANFSDLDQNLKKYEQDLLKGLKQQHNAYQKMTFTLSFEKAVMDHNPFELNKVLDKNFDLYKPFNPFFNPVFKDTFYQETQQITGMKLIEKNWPSLLEPVKKDVIGLNEVLSHEHGDSLDSLLSQDESVAALSIPVVPDNPANHFLAPIKLEMPAIAPLEVLL